jgi:DNA-binding NarL/FixJ family response regulator
MSAPVKLVVIDDDRALARELAKLVARGNNPKLVASYHDAESALSVLTAQPPHTIDVALVDLHLPRMSGVELIRALAEKQPAIQCIAFTVSADEEMVFAALDAGACGYLLKHTPADKITSGVLEAAAGGAPMTPAIARRVLGRFRERGGVRAAAPRPAPAAVLSPREVDVLEALAQGLSYKLIADRLEIAIGTVQVHIRAIYRKLSISTKAEAAAEAFRRGLIH